MKQIATSTAGSGDFPTNIDALDMLYRIEAICMFAMLPGASSEDISLAIDNFDTITAPLPAPHPRMMVLLYLSLVGLLSDAYEREAVQTICPGIYIIEYSNGTVKIGRTSFYEKRYRQLAMQGGISAKRGKFFPCREMCKAESMAHSHFRDQRLSDEFFAIKFDDGETVLSSIAADC